MTKLGILANKKAMTIYVIVGAGILLSALLISSVASTWAQNRQQVAINGSMNPNFHKQYMNAHDSSIPKINGSVNVVENIGNILKQNAKISFSAGADTAQKQLSNATVVGGHLGVTQGYLTYTYFAVDTNKQISYTILIDAGNGNVLYKSEGKEINSFVHMGQSGKVMSGPFGHSGPFGLWGNRFG